MGPIADKSPSPFAGFFSAKLGLKKCFPERAKEEVIAGKMHTSVVSTIGAVSLTIAMMLAAAPAAAQSSAIEGTWELVSRTLPNGQMMKHPDIQGVLSFVDGYRNINVLYRTQNGSCGSYPAVASYEIS